MKWTDKEMSSGAWHSRNCQSDLKTQVVLSEWELCIQDSLLENCISGITPCLKLQTDSFDLQKMITDQITAATPVIGVNL